MIRQGAHLLSTVDPRLVAVVQLASERVDLAVLEGHRGQAAQDAAVARGASKVAWPRGSHNALPSRAVDLAPHPVRWPDEKGAGIARVKRYTAFGLLAGHVLAAAAQLGIALRWGGDWDRDGDNEDQSFDDLPHFELAPEVP